MFYKGRVSETLCFTRVRNRNFAFYDVFLTLELLKHCVLRGSSLSNTVFCGDPILQPVILLCVFNIGASKTPCFARVEFLKHCVLRE